MRPPQNAGEDQNAAFRFVVGEGRFNETPAERGGRLLGARYDGGNWSAASMRPPQNAGEDRTLGRAIRWRSWLQ